MTARSESARATTAAESRFRIDAPNSQPRHVMVVALDRPSETVVKRLAQMPWSRAGFFTASAFAGSKPQAAGFSMQGWLSDLAGRTKNLIDEVAAADLVVMVASAGEDAQAGGLIGEACQARRVMTTALVLGASEAAGAATAAQLRPWANMLVAASSEEYIADMLTALRA
jgi:hypothetical protein